MIYTENQAKIRNLLFSKEKSSRDIGWELDKTQNDSYFHKEMPDIADSWEYYWKLDRVLINSKLSMLKYWNFVNHSPYVKHLTFSSSDNLPTFKIPNRVESIVVDNGMPLRDPKSLLKGLSNLKVINNKSDRYIHLHPENINSDLEISTKVQNDLDSRNFELLTSAPIKSLCLKEIYGTSIIYNRHLRGTIENIDTRGIKYMFATLSRYSIPKNVEYVRLIWCRLRNIPFDVHKNPNLKEVHIDESGAPQDFQLDVDIFKHPSLERVVVPIPKPLLRTSSVAKHEKRNKDVEEFVTHINKHTLRQWRGEIIYDGTHIIFARK